MIINKKLKNAEFEYNEETKKFLIIDPENGNVVELNKVYAFAFMRFVVRMAQKNWLRKTTKTKKDLDLVNEDVLPSEEENNPNQLEMFNF